MRDPARRPFLPIIAPGRIDTAARAKVYASRHHNLLPFRYEKSRGRHLGNRQFFGFSDLRNELVLRRPYRGTSASVLYGRGCDELAGFA